MRTLVDRDSICPPFPFLHNDDCSLLIQTTAHIIPTSAHPIIAHPIIGHLTTVYKTIAHPIIARPIIAFGLIIPETNCPSHFHVLMVGK